MQQIVRLLAKLLGEPPGGNRVVLPALFENPADNPRLLAKTTLPSVGPECYDLNFTALGQLLIDQLPQLSRLTIAVQRRDQVQYPSRLAHGVWSSGKMVGRGVCIGSQIIILLLILIIIFCFAPQFPHSKKCDEDEDYE